MDAHRILSLCLMVALFAGVPPGALADAPTAAVRLSGPAEANLEADDMLTVGIHVSGRITCTEGLEAPADLLVVPAPHRSVERSVHIEPGESLVPWNADPHTPGTFRIDAWVAFNVTAADTHLDAPLEAPIVLTVREVHDEDVEARCDLEGYTMEVQPHAVALHVVPDADAAVAVMGDDAPPVRLAPILLALLILGAMAAFAGLRERQRRH